LGLLRLDPRERAAVAGLFLIAAIGFVLPFVTSTAPDRTGRATGIQLVGGSPEYEGEYLHAAFEGEVETLMENGFLPARISFAAVLVGLGLALIPRRRSVVGSVLASAVALIGLVWVRSATATPFSPPSTTLEYGFWLTGVLIVVAAAYAFVLLRRDRRRADEEDPYDVTPWTRYQQPN
jgi:hypothetical protein